MRAVILLRLGCNLLHPAPGVIYFGHVPNGVGYGNGKDGDDSHDTDYQKNFEQGKSIALSISKYLHVRYLL